MERAFWLAWSQIPGIGSILLQRLHHHFGTLAAAWNASPAQLEAVGGFGEQSAAAIATARRTLDPEILLQQHERDNPCFWTPADADYPQLLREVPDPPALLYYRGQVEPLENSASIPTIAMVGTRHPSDYGRRWTRRISKTLAEAGFTVVSGLAAGVDTEAHRSCLLAGGRTIAVLGTGVDVIYPWSNRELAGQIVQQGLLVSEYPAGTQPDRVNFPRRNRIIAALCRATLVLEAPQKSGALITARLANEYSRDVYVLPGSLDNPKSMGCLELLNQGAQLILGEDYLLEVLGMLPSLTAHRSASGQLSLLPPSTALEPDLQTVLNAVTLEPIAIDRVVHQARLPTEIVSSALMQLELLGLVAQLPGMHYQRV